MIKIRAIFLTIATRILFVFILLRWWQHSTKTISPGLVAVILIEIALDFV